MIASWFAFADQGKMFPDSLPVPLKLLERAALWREPAPEGGALCARWPVGKGIGQATQVQGKELSYNNLNDADAALELVSEFRDAAPTVVIVKHANPCGVATAGTLDRRISAGLRLRPRLGLWRHHCRQPAARRPDGRGDHRYLHRGRRGARCR